MAYIAPNTDIYLLKNIKINPNYSDTIYFANATAQYNYFSNSVKRVATLSANMYTRHSRGAIKVKLPLTTVAQANYMMFKNTSYENKWFYAFITDWEYVNNGTTLIYFSIDVIQTWLLNCTLGDCFVEREHAMNDAIGANRIPEPVGSDRVMMKKVWECSDMTNYSVVIQASQTNRGSAFEEDYFHQGQFNGLCIAIDDCNDGSDASGIAAVLENMIGDGTYSDDATNQQQVVSVIMFPTRFTTDGNRAHHVNDGFGTPRTNVNGYVPRNKKLLTSPYKKLLLTNGIGAQAVLDYDEFVGSSGSVISPAFEIVGTFNGDGQIMCIPYYYKGVEFNYDYKITISNFPQCGYTLDSYRAWLASGGDVKQQTSVIKGVASGIFGLLGSAQSVNNQYQKNWNDNYKQRYAQSTQGKNLNQGALNAVNVGATNYANQNTSILDAVADSGVLGGVGGALNGALNTYIDYKTTEYDAQAQSNIPVGMTAGNVMVGDRSLNFRCYDVDINKVDAEIIDEFFDKYGYQTNRLKVPNISGRPQWNYIKTAGCELFGNIPADVKSSITSIFDSGITFWKNGDNIGDYSLDNSIV